MPRRLTSAFVVAAALVLTAIASPAPAAVKVGDRPKLEFMSANGMGQVSLEKLRGKILVVDFWAVWCGPCMAEAAHMAQLHQTYGPKGLQMIGISLDQSKVDMIRTAKEKGFDWPQYCDAQVWDTRYAREWGVNSIPRTFIIGPDGDVLWTGHPAQIDKPLADAFKNHPPRLVDPKVLADAGTTADTIEAAIQSGGHASAIKQLAAIPADARKDAAFNERMSKIEQQFADFAEKSLADVDPLVREKKYVEAADKLQDLSAALGALPAGATAKKRLSELMSNPEAKAQFAAAQKNKAAGEELAVAKRLASEKKDDQAYLRFKQVAANFADTPAAAEAKAAVATYEKNPAFVQKVNETAASGKAKAAMQLAENYARAGRKDLAKKKYEDVITAYPNTSFAREAQAAIKGL